MWGNGRRLAEHERENREDFSNIRHSVEKISDRLEAHAREARDGRALTEAKIDLRHQENREQLDKLKRIVWIATGAVAVVLFVLREIAAPELLHLLGVK